jgi:hypothetical protein
MSCKQEFDEKLIHCVHSFPVIYDPSKKSYKIMLGKALRQFWDMMASS